MASDHESTWVRPSVFLSIAFLVLAVVAGSIVLGRAHHSAAPAAAPSPAPTPTATQPSVPAIPSVASVPPPPTTPRGSELPDQTVPVTGPPATWITVETLSLPISGRYGPAVDNGTIMAGYEHSPTGALFADADNRGRFSIVRDWRTATLSAVADTPGRAAFIKARTPFGIAPAPTPGTFTQIAGFNFVSYTPDRAVIQILREANDGSLTTTTDTVIWQSDDWKILLEPSGDSAPVASLPSGAGYTPWKASS